MKFLRRNSHLFSIFLLLCILRVGLPVGEFFHHHHFHTDKQICEAHTHKKCEHREHLFEKEHSHPDCIALLIFNSFIVQDFYFEVIKFENISEKFWFSESYIGASKIKSSSRAPPFFLLL